MVKKIDPEVKRKWIVALRSGKYTQGRNALSSVNYEGVRSLCVLGVLCEVAANEGIIPAANNVPYGTQHYGGAAASLPVEVREWAGFEDTNGDVEVGPGQTLMYLNDTKRKTFDELAKVIKQSL